MNLDPSALPADLADLRQAYLDLPPRSVRWQVDIGQKFLDQLEAATNRYPVRVVAEALGVGHQAIYYMRWRTRHGHTETWPDNDQLREFRAAWRVVQARHAGHQQVRRNSPEFERVHLALMALRENRSYTVVTQALGISTRQLRRYLDPPLNSPAEIEELATLVHLYHQLPRRLRIGRRPVVITAEFSAALDRAVRQVSIHKIARALDMDVAAIERILSEYGQITS